MVGIIQEFERAHVYEDRISCLPADLLHCVLSHLPIQDSVRTSILSRNWRYVWTRCPNIVLDRQFAMFLQQKRSLMSLRQGPFGDVIRSILLQHDVQISIFVLDLGKIAEEYRMIIDQCILFLSGNGVKEFTLMNSGHPTYYLPHCIFSCQQIQNLVLRNSFFKLPYSPQGFTRLNRLYLAPVDFSINAGSDVLNTPNLYCIAFRRCSGFHCLKIHAPSLVNLFASSCQILELSSLLVFKRLRLVYVYLSTLKMGGNDFSKVRHLPQLLNKWHEIEWLQLNEFLFKDMAKFVICNWMKLSFLTELSLKNFKSTSMKHVSQTMNLIRGVPSLSKLEIHITTSLPNPSSSSNEAAVAYLESLSGDIWNLNLKDVDIRGFTGSRHELIMVKLLLASSPSLFQISIKFVQGSSIDNLHKVSMDILKCPRASPIAAVNVISLPE